MRAVASVPRYYLLRMTVAVLLGDAVALVVLVVAVADLMALLLIGGVTLLLVNGLINRLVGGLALEQKSKMIQRGPKLSRVGYISS